MSADAINADWPLDWSYAFGGPCGSGLFKQYHEDFEVTELLGFEPEGHGEHLFLWIEKQGHNTEWITRQLSKLCEVPPRDISYAGLKDRHGITRQWISVQLPGRPDPDLSSLEADGTITVLRAERHPRKLRRGVHQGNQFKIRLRNVQGDHQQLESRLVQIARDGFPNYFGEQRFGIDGNNMKEAAKLLSGEIRIKNRSRRSLYLSAARSWLFNTQLSRRVRGESWNRYLNGDLLSFFGSQSLVNQDRIDDTVLAKFAEQQLSPTGPLWGAGTPSSRDAVLQQEQALSDQFPLLCDGLVRVGMRQERRRLQALAKDLQWHFEGDDLMLKFSLESGCYATALLRELINLESD